MSKGQFQEAMDNVNMVYGDLIKIANDMVTKVAGDTNRIIEEIRNRIETLTNDELRTYMAKLAINSYSFSEIKEKSAFKAQCAEALRKEAYATNFSTAEGSVAAKENTATINTSDEIVVENLYELVASLLKTKLDEIHRVVDVLKTVLMSRLSEAKLNNFSDATTNE